GNPVDVPAVQAAMRKAAQETNVPNELSAAAHEWMRRSAVESIGLLKDPTAAKLLIDIVADEKASLGFRCEAARSLGSLPLKPGNAAVGNAAAAARLGELAATIAENQTER